MGKYKINFDSNGKHFVYRGDLIEETDDFVVLNDIKLGRVTLNKRGILSMIPISDSEGWF